MKRDDKGAIVQLPYGLEAFAPSRHLRKENGKLAEVDETLTFKVIEFNRDDKRIMVSHLRYLEDIQREAEEVVKDERRKQGQEVKQSVKEQQAKYEPTTLGDMAMFSQLKEQLAEAKGKKTSSKEAAIPAAEEPVAHNTTSNAQETAENNTLTAEDKVIAHPTEQTVDATLIALEPQEIAANQALPVEQNIPPVNQESINQEPTENNESEITIDPVAHAAKPIERIETIEEQPEDQRNTFEEAVSDQEEIALDTTDKATETVEEIVSHEEVTHEVENNIEKTESNIEKNTPEENTQEQKNESKEKFENKNRTQT
jgi:hypothetical protein